jgi:mono/diheme cytochrome c family protein
MFGHVRSFALLAGLGMATVTTACRKPGDAPMGAELFATACARCHGPEGRGGLPLVDGGPSPRNFHDHEFQVSHTDDQLKQTIINGKGTGMPPFGTTFTEAQLASLVAYVRSCDRGTK